MKLFGSPHSLSLPQDRRRDRRQRIDRVTYLNVEPDNGGILLDLSEGGMCISLANPLAKSTQIHFSLWLEEGRTIEGTGQVRWLSESGRSAGVRFLSVSEDTREKIRECLASSCSPLEETKPFASTAETEYPARTGQTAPVGSEVSSQQSAQRPAQTPPPAPAAPETYGKDPAPTTPLFFLPKKQEPEADPYYSQEQTYTWHPEGSSQDDGEAVVAYRSAIASTESEEEEEQEEEKGRRSSNALLVATVFLALLAGGVATIVAYPSKFSQFRQFAASLTAPPAETTAAPVEIPKPRRNVRHRRVARRRAPSGPQRGSRAVHDVKSFYAPDSGQTNFPVQVTGYDQQRWLATASGRRFVPPEAQPSSPDANPSSPNDGSPEQTTTNAPPSAPPATPTISPPPMRPQSLRVDGGLVDEGEVSPTFSPLNLNGQTLITKPIVVEAVIGKDGGVKDVRLVSSPSSSLAQAVVSAVKLWRYRPFYQNGQPIEFVTRITFDFSLPETNR